MPAPLTIGAMRGEGWRNANRLGLVLAVLMAAAVLFVPFATLRANRIAPGDGRAIWEALPPGLSITLLCALAVVALIGIAPGRPLPRLVASVGTLGLLAVAIGVAASHLTPAGDRLARVSPASGFWLLLLALVLAMADALARLSPTPRQRIALTGLGLAALAAILASGFWDELSVMREYQGRAESFHGETRQHLVLAFGSMAAAVLAGVPLGLVCHRVAALRAPVLNLLNVIQTIPSIALFGLLIAPLAWLAANLPAAAALGIRGIGTAPAFLALFLYSLLPVVANTVAGLAGVPAAVRDAARGMGMTGWQRLIQVELPLAVPVLVTGVRIVLVQNIGLATIAALIGGGGFGVFVFQGIGQMAMDLVLLGAIPTVILAVAAAVLLDALAELASIPTGARRD